MSLDTLIFGSGFHFHFTAQYSVEHLYHCYIHIDLVNNNWKLLFQISAKKRKKTARFKTRSIKLKNMSNVKLTLANSGRL